MTWSPARLKNICQETSLELAPELERPSRNWNQNDTNIQEIIGNPSRLGTGTHHFCLKAPTRTGSGTVHTSGIPRYNVLAGKRSQCQNLVHLLCGLAIQSKTLPCQPLLRILLRIQILIQASLQSFAELRCCPWINNMLLSSQRIVLWFRMDDSKSVACHQRAPAQLDMDGRVLAHGP